MTIGLQEISDRLEIDALFGKLSYFQDARLWNRLDEVLAEELSYGHTTSDAGPNMVKLNWKALVENWRKPLERMLHTQHLYSNLVIEVAGDRAHVHLAETGFLQRDLPIGDKNWFFGTEQEATLSRLEVGWRITELRVTPTWGSGNIGVLGGWAPPAEEDR